MGEQVCTYIVNGSTCNKPMVLQTNAVVACEEHAVLLAKALHIKWRCVDAQKLNRIRELLWTKRPEWFLDSLDYAQTKRMIEAIKEIINE